MSASDNSNNNGQTNHEQKEQEVEAAVGRTDVQDGNSPRDGRLPVTATRDPETTQPEEGLVATKLNVLAREQEENEGSSSEEGGPSSEGSGSLPELHGICLTQAARDLEMATVIEGGVRQGAKPSWSFTGRLSVPYGNKRGANDPATGADNSATVDRGRQGSKRDPGSDEGG
jgi:hypothetical protein